jgi:hypothetical protein
MNGWRYCYVILDFGTRRDESGQFHAPAASLPGIERQYPMDGRLGGPQELVSTLWKTEKSPARTWDRTPADQPVFHQYSVLAHLDKLRKQHKSLRGFSPHANYIDKEAAACRRS